ncbi:lipid A deacylase LpxR family protein [Psychromonas algicola]|uniref:lipid A deacylase LpxR family protein n=1 Tax=Psychromonas algicola TaxID=2555642 RepID=UPI00141A0367|nr:lipid A deacylase LpxR family protein [Psychromonas sp. RZ5]
MHRIKLIILCLFCLPVFASEQDVDYLSLSFENDVFFREDDGYSNGFTFNWGYYDVSHLNESSLPTWLSFLAKQSYINHFDDRQYQVNYTFGQFIQTATDIKISELTEKDAPYVGLIAWKANIMAYNDNISDELSLTLGAVGPATGGETIQKNLHDVIRANRPLGWDNQINNEVVFRIEGERLWRHSIASFKQTEMDLVTGINAGFGNLLSDVNVGIGLRWGKALSANFSSSSPFMIQKLNGLKPNPNGWYVFANLSTSLVLNDIFIDGNTFEDSHSVDLIHWQAGLAAGIQLNLYDWNIIYTMIHSTDQYETQSDETRWGDITVTYHF